MKGKNKRKRPSTKATVGDAETEDSEQSEISRITRAMKRRKLDDKIEQLIKDASQDGDCDLAYELDRLQE